MSVDHFRVSSFDTRSLSIFKLRYLNRKKIRKLKLPPITNYGSLMGGP